MPLVAQQIYLTQMMEGRGKGKGGGEGEDNVNPMVLIREPR